MKDFNNLKINGQVYDKEKLLELIQKKVSLEEWEQDFFAFIGQWLNDENFIAVKTSGSTGKPKTIQILKSRMLASAQMTCDFFKLKQTDTALLCLSTKHIGGMMMVVRAFYCGFNLITKPPSSNPLTSLSEPIDFIALVPFQAKTILAENTERLRLISNIIIGGGTVDHKLSMALKNAQVKAYSTFGMTETISHIALQEIGQEDYYTCLSGVKVERSKAGTLIINAPKLLDKSLETNDLIELISPEQFSWLGRADFAIESGGLKFIPEQIEQKLAPKMKSRFMVSSKPHPQLNNEIILIIEGAAYPISDDFFDDLSVYERPKHIYFLEKFIESSNSKINRIKTSALLELF